MKYKRDLANPLAPTFSSAKPKRPKKKKKVQNLKQVNVPVVGRYTDKEQSISKAKKQAKNFSKNKNTGYAVKVKPNKVKTSTYKDGKLDKVTIAKKDKPAKVVLKRGLRKRLIKKQ